MILHYARRRIVVKTECATRRRTSVLLAETYFAIIFNGGYNIAPPHSANLAVTHTHTHAHTSQTTQVAAGGGLNTNLC